MGEPEKFRETFKDFEERANRRLKAFEKGNYRIDKEGLDKFWRGIRFGDLKVERRFLDLVALVRLLKEIYDHEFVRQVVEHARELGLRVDGLDVSAFEKAEYLALEMLDERGYKRWMPWLGSIGVMKDLQRRGIIPWSTVGGFEFLELTEDEDGFKLTLRDWHDIAKQILELNALAESKG